MALTNILQTYGDSSRVQSVLPLVEILTAKENWFLANLQKAQAKDTIHGVLTDTLRTAATASVAEGTDFTYGARTQPTRTDNIVQINAIPFRVTKTAQQVQRYHGQNEKARQLTKALVDWGNAAEFDIVRSTLASGLSGTTPRMSGILEAISKSTTVTAHTSGTVFSASVLKGLLRNNWDNSNGEPVTDLFLNSNLKEDLDSFTAGATKFVQLGEELRDYVDVYDGGGFGRVAVHLHRYLFQSGDATGRVLGVRRDKLALAYLEEPNIQDKASDGDYDAMVVIGKLTLECRNQDTNFYSNGFLL